MNIFQLIYCHIHFEFRSGSFVLYIFKLYFQDGSAHELSFICIFFKKKKTSSSNFLLISKSSLIQIVFPHQVVLNVVIEFPPIEVRIEIDDTRYFINFYVCLHFFEQKGFSDEMMYYSWQFKEVNFRFSKQYCSGQDRNHQQIMSSRGKHVFDENLIPIS